LTGAVVMVGLFGEFSQDKQNNAMSNIVFSKQRNIIFKSHKNIIH
jgi:hypothetical protein